MTLNRILRGMAGVVVLGSLALGIHVSPNWFYLTAFAGVNLLQSAFSNWCPAIWMLKKAGVKDK
ncbi:MAG: DUF2892 domain-containing protein [bacterium]|nr:DUF2892 domain-containing protein [bacterium]